MTTSPGSAPPPTLTDPSPSRRKDTPASLTHHPLHPPTLPEPCAQPPPARTSRDAVPTHAAMAANPPRHSASPPYKTASMSSADESSTLTAMSSFDLEKGSLARDHDRHTRRSLPQSYVDPEKAFYRLPQSYVDQEKAFYRSPQSHVDQEKAFYKAQIPSGHRSPRQSGHRRSRRDAASITFSDAESDFDAGLALQEAKALNILLFLSGPVVALSWLNFVWTLISLLITTLSQPVRLCARRIPFGQQLASLLGPALTLQLKSIYTPLPPYANEDGVFHPAMLVFVHLISPILSIGVALAAWVVAVYWLMAGIVGDPAGMDKRDDGKETVLGLRHWWEHLLLKGVNLQ